MFESLKSTLQALLHGQVAPADRRAVIADMKQALVAAKLGVADLREGVEVTRARLAAEREQLAVVQRRKALAASVPDAETVAIAERFEAQHAERIGVLERKLAAQEDEASLAEREYEEMLKQLKAASAGVGSGATPATRGPTDAELGLPDDAGLRSEFDALARNRARSDAEAAADARLEELKKKMGR
ncbi:MAG TPA: hypothetical protein VG916_16155 [Gemmatimonadaceae bacterium]|nr:hypothetical protein [Gemmatimonadaceae bacterium]